MAELYPKVHPYAQPEARPQVRALDGNGGSLARDLVARTDTLAAARSEVEREWRDLADYCLPTLSNAMAAGAQGSGFDRLVDAGPSTRAAARKRFDSTALTAIDRLASGMESLVTPQSEKWHGLELDDPLAGEAADEEKAWFERVRDKLFAIRYEPKAGFTTANQKAIRSVCTFGTAVVFCEEAFGAMGSDPRSLPVLYRHIPLSQAFIDVNVQGEPDTLHRRFSLPARVAMQRFAGRLSQKARDLADDPKKCDTHINFTHAVQPRDEFGSRGTGNRKAPFASYYIETDSHHLIGEGGFYEFPYIVYYWLQGDDSAYGESPAMLALDDIRGLNVARKTALRAMQQWVDPPIAIAHDGVMNRPNLNPRAVNFNAIDGQGNVKIRPILTAQNPAVVQQIIEEERRGIRSLLHNDLFQILIQNPGMTATEAMLRANEKGELLGPAGAKIQAALSRMIDREYGILERKGAFEPGASLEAPRSLQGKAFSPRFTSPLDRLRQMKEATGIMTAYQAAAQIAAARGNPDIFDNFDDDKALKIIAEVNGAPMSMMKTAKERDGAREARAQMMQAQQAMAMAKEASSAAADAVPAIGQMAEMAGALPSSNTAPLPLPALVPEAV